MSQEDGRAPSLSPPPLPTPGSRVNPSYAAAMPKLAELVVVGDRAGLRTNQAHPQKEHAESPASSTRSRHRTVLRCGDGSSGVIDP